jgi:heme/copper-type cytochrome/quinol oxidase subunit 2
MHNLGGAGNAVARVFLWPGDLTCSLMGLEGDDKRELVRMLVNSLIWILIGMLTAVAIT